MKLAAAIALGLLTIFACASLIGSTWAFCGFAGLPPPSVLELMAVIAFLGALDFKDSTHPVHQDPLGYAAVSGMLRIIQVVLVSCVCMIWSWVSQ